MSAAVHRGTPALSVPPTQNTAPVLEFNCLYTHDLRRKQKRWQDGFLRYHTFNKRIMVYDVPRNFVGDLHWKEEQPLQEGDEVILDKGGALVQVADSIGTTETDLSELLASAKKAPAKNDSSPLRSMLPPNRKPTGASRSRLPHSKHTSLNALLGTPRGPLGKATLPVRSPFEQRHTELESSEWNSSRPPKRQRIDQPIVSPPKTTAIPMKPIEPHSWARTNQTSKSKAPDIPKRSSDQPPVVVELRDDKPGIEQSLVEPSSGALEQSPSHRQHAGLPTMRCRGSKPDIWARTNPETNTAVARIEPDACNVFPDPHETNRPEIVRPLRFATTVPKKKTLLCQGQMVNSSKNSGDGIRVQTIEAVESTRTVRRTKSAREKLEERLARINSKKRQDNPRISDEAVTPGPQNAGVQNPIDILACRTGGTIARGYENKSPYSAPRMQQHSVLRPDSQRPNTAIDGESIPSPPGSRALKPPVSAPPVLSADRPATTIQSFEQEHAAYTPTPALAPSKDISKRGGNFHRLTCTSRNKKSYQHAVSLHTASNGTSTAILAKPFQVQGRPELAGSRETTPVPTIPALPPDPWSREAFDLFDWRPPGWHEDDWCLKDSDPA
ncbi:Hypothetical protein R9X50_00589300 [Acrodontium crateriforme]|uniref:5'-3' DNA helicase ZGRF1-like N-terminal domain-containing protein n=1 Tax=Acrodontium crateriforme TaxID=150365 RepID=A0AAQ3M7F0_9PEZI|nr:Hypothetical protein R9X50_00589300 [Acrodontium crateriforme]